MLLEVLASELIRLHFQRNIVEVLLGIGLAMVEVNLYWLLDHVHILFVLVPEAGNNRAIVWLTEDVNLVDLILHLSLQIGCYGTVQCLHQ